MCSMRVSCNAHLLHRSCGDKRDFIWEEPHPDPLHGEGFFFHLISFLGDGGGESHYLLLVLLFLQRYLQLIQGHVILYV